MFCYSYYETTNALIQSLVSDNVRCDLLLTDANRCNELQYNQSLGTEMVNALQTALCNVLCACVSACVRACSYRVSYNLAMAKPKGPEYVGCK